jgi:16S rRNA (adenine1518-N6/adenine1519-N6)-dimethyltransferase
MRIRPAEKVRPKKSLGQHFLHDKNIALRIVQSLYLSGKSQNVLEIGPGMGVLTEFLLRNDQINLVAVEIDRDSVAYLRTHYPSLRIVEGDFLEMNINDFFHSPFSIIGNFPYNISSQIFFKILEQRNSVQQTVCMLQKEVADRIASPSGNKTYGILSVLLQTFYRVDYLFKVPSGVFQPPPKVMSAVIRLTRNTRESLPCNEDLFFKVVKQGFNNRRKTLRNALKNLILPAPENRTKEVQEMMVNPLFDKRAEQLTVEDFISLTQLIEKNRGGIGSL